MNQPLYILSDNDSKDISYLVSLFEELDIKSTKNKNKNKNKNKHTNTNKHSKSKSKNRINNNDMIVENNCKIIVPYDFTFDTIIKRIYGILNNNIQI
jgi:hypothetical protein